MSGVKFLAVSDLHLDFHADKGRSLIDELCSKAKAADATLVLAGDVDAKEGLHRSLKRFAETGADIVYILGNHECWGRTIDHAKKTPRLIASKYPNFHFLDKSHVDIRGVRVHGCTGWFPRTEECENLQFSDKTSVKKSADIYREAKDDLRYLLTNVRPGDVVVTHHLPHERSIAAEFVGDAYNVFFLNPGLSEILRENRPSLWVHGHTHHQRCYRVWDTDVICNPFGYLHYEVRSQAAFRTDIIFEVEPP